MYIEVVRSGGLIGVPLRGTIDTAELPAPTATQVKQELNRLAYGAPAAPPRHPDSFQYEITVVDGNRRRSALLDEAQLPEGLRPVIDAALARASP
jgi:hypothetical protein